MNKKFILKIAAPILVLAIIIIVAIIYFSGKGKVTGENFTMIEKSAFTGGKLPPAEREQFKNDLEKKHSCSVDPNMIEMKANEVKKLMINLSSSDPGNSYRVILGDLPIGTTGELVEGNGEAVIQLQVGDNPQIGSFSLAVIYQVMDKKGLLSAGEMKTAVCQYNLVINR